MAQQIKLKRSAIAGKVPSTGSLAAGELAINTVDGKLYFKRDDDTIQSIVTTNATITGSVNINGSITGSDVRINQWGSVSASLATISSQAAAIPTLDQVTDQGDTTTNFIQVGGISTFTTGGFITGVFKTTDGPNIVILESTGTGGTNPGSTTLQFRDTKGTQTNGSIIYGGNAGDYLRLNTSAGATFGITGSTTDSNYVFSNNSGTGSFSWDLNSTFIQKIGGGATQFLGNATTATTATSASFATTASFASTAPFTGITGKPTLVSSSAQIDLSQATGIAANAISASYALTASHASNLTISGNITSVNYIDFNTGSGDPGWKSGRVYFNNDDGALTVYNEEADIALQVGQENWTKVRNNTGALIPNGTVVRINGAQGDRPTITPAASLAVSGAVNLISQILGVATHDIEDSSFGFVTTQGFVRGLNTSAYSNGDTLFVSSSAGKFTKTPPSAPYEIIPVGIVTKAGPGGSGIIYVAVQQPLDFSDLSSVKVEGNYTHGDLLVYSGSGAGGVWRHTHNLMGDYQLTGSLGINGTLTGNLTGNASTATTASYALKAESVGQLNQNVVVNGNLQVFGTSSFTYVTSSQLNVADSYISVNVFEPAERFGGLKVYDSGSLSHLATASLAWDSQRNHWVYTNASGSTYSGGGFMSGPRNTGSLGAETYPTYNTVLRGQGGDHLYDSNIKDNDTAVQVGIPLQVTGSLTTTGKVNINTVDNYGSDPDKFLAIVSNEVVYRTGAQLLSDIGGQTAGTFVQNAGSGGQARYIMRYEDSNSATTSSIYEATTGNIGIKKTNPSAALDINGSAIVSGSLTIQGTTAVVQEVITVTGTSTLAIKSINTTTYQGAFLDYLIASGSNRRAGTLATVWTPSDIEWNDVSTLDLGSTVGAEFTPAINGSNADLVLAVPAGTWTVKGHLRYM
jgi:hypothetical protein